MPLFFCTGELIFDPKIEKIPCRVRKETRKHKEEQSIAASPRFHLELELADSFSAILSDSNQEYVIMVNARTLRELATPNLHQQPLCITFPALADNTPFELKSSTIHLLPPFHGLSGEEPHKHLREFDVVCTSMT